MNSDGHSSPVKHKVEGKSHKILKKWWPKSPMAAAATAATAAAGRG